MTADRPQHESAHDRYLATRHFGSLDGLRFICISAVIWHHMPDRPDTIMLFARGHVGVDFFFVLSGFLITTLLLREEAAKGAFSLRSFYWRRILRIIPIYFLVVSVAAVYAIVIKGQTQELAILPYYYLFLSNFLIVEDIGFLAPTWSLAVEEQYYLIWPALLLLLPRRWIVAVLVLLIVVNVLAVTDIFALIGIYAVDVAYLRLQITGTTYAPILMGSFAAILLNHPQSFAALGPLAGFRGAPWMWFIALIVALGALPHALEGLPNLMVHSLMCLMLISLVIREDNYMAPILKLPPITRIGQISYGIYLYHLFALSVVMKGFEMAGITSVGWILIFYYVLSIVIAEISFRYFETWFMQFREHGPGRVKRKTPHPL